MSTRALPPRGFGDADNAEYEEIDGTADDISALEGDLDGLLSSITSEFSADENDVEFTMMIYRVVTGTGNMEYLFTILPHELPVLDRLRDEYGGGDFETRVYRKTAGQRKKLFRKFRQKIAAPPKREYVAPQKVTSDLSEIANVMMQGFQQTNAMISEIMKQNVPQNATINPLEMMQGMIATLVSMQQLMPQNKTDSGIDTAIKFLELGKDLGSDKETSSTDVLLETIRSIGPILTKSVETSQKPENASIKNNIPSQSTVTNPAEKPSMLNPTQMMIKSQLKNLVKVAAAGKDPELYADLILDQVPTFQLTTMINSPTLLEDLAKLDPAVNRHQTWFTTLVTIIRDTLENPEEDIVTDAIKEDETENVNNGGAARDT